MGGTDVDTPLGIVLPRPSRSYFPIRHSDGARYPAVIRVSTSQNVK